MKESKNIGFVAVAVIVGLVVGFVIARATDNSTTKTTTASATPSASTAAATLRSNLVTLGVEHMTYTDQAIDAALDGNADASALSTALYANGNAIGAAVGSVYGAPAQKTFDAVWKIHLNEFVDYAVADSKGDSAGMTAALKAIQNQYTIPLAQYLAKANPNLPEATLQTDLANHVAMTAQMINDHVQKNYTAEANELSMANTHIAALFSTLAGAIVKQFPAKFAN